MKRLLLLLLVLASCTPRPELSKAFLSREGILIIESIHADNEYFDDITIVADTAPENGSFNEILVWKDGDMVFSDYHPDGLDTLTFAAFHATENKVKSALILYHETSRGGYLFMKGADYGCCVPTMTVVKVDASGFHKIFDEGFQINKLQSLGNGDLLFYGIRSNAEPVPVGKSSDTLLSAYNPTIVLSLAHDLKMDSAVTKTFNENEYVFAGYSYREDVKVAYSREKRFKPYIPEVEETDPQDDCVFENNYRKLTTDWLRESGIESFTWDDKNNRAIIAHEGDTTFASKGGCEHFGILLERRLAFDVHPPDHFDYWLGEAQKLAEQYGFEFYAREIKAGKILGINETNGSVWYEVGDDDPTDNLYYNGIEIRSAEKSKTISISQYYN